MDSIIVSPDPTIVGTPNVDTLSGNANNNVIYGFGSGDRLFGGAGNDVIYGDRRRFPGHIVGAPGNDSIYGGAGNDRLYGDDGNDYLNGGTGADRMYGGAGNDRYRVDSFNDRIFEGSNQGIDTAETTLNNYTLTGGVNNLTLIGSQALRGNGNTLNNVIRGNQYNNILVGNGGNDTLFGYDGNDWLYGSVGNDRLYGGDGNDTMIGGAGADRMLGGDGNDYYVIDSVGDVTVEYANGGIDTAASTLETYSLTPGVNNLSLIGQGERGYGNSLNNVMRGNAGDNLLSGNAGNDTLLGYNGRDRLVGGSGNDTIRGGNQNDSLHGGLGSDSLYGDAGNDYLNGVSNNQLLFTSAPNQYDRLTGGSGADRFALAVSYQLRPYYTQAGYATITDFSRAAGDKIQITSNNGYYLGTGNWRGTAQTDTGIFYRGNLIGVVQDNTQVSLAADFQRIPYVAT
ncbi:MAG: calcium-binding protein [Elainellaceae cyanobacterium]